MSFRCDNCGMAQDNRTKPIRRVVETRMVEHTNLKRRYDERTGQVTETREPCGSGSQIVRESNLCAMCNGRAERSEASDTTEPEANGSVS